MKKLIELVSQEAAEKRSGIILGGVFAGIANTAILACVNVAVKSPNSSPIILFIIFIISILMFVFFARYSNKQIAILLERALYKNKLRITDKLRRIEYEGLEQIGTAEIYDRVTENLTSISDAATSLSVLLRAFFMVIFGGFFLFSLSVPSFILVVLTFYIFISLYLNNARFAQKHIRKAGQKRLFFFDALTDLLHGFQEVKFSQRRSKELQEEISRIADEVQTSTLQATLILEDNSLIPSINMFALLGILAFVLPQFVQQQSSVTSFLITLALYIFSPINSFMANAPASIRANVALENIQQLEQKLDASLKKNADRGSDPWSGQLKTIEAQNIEYRYRRQNEEQSFHIGPVSLTVGPGEILFIVGGNGSGKSTLLKVLTGIYPATAGTLRVNGVAVQPTNLQAYREMVSAIFTDFHIFKKLYGLDEVDAAAVFKLLERMQLERKTSFAENYFTDVSLSTGQRKRLALIVALLEDRAVYAFDEWAADQDPPFRRYFYEELLPELKRRGKAVLVVTHDDRYFYCADRIATMEYGTLRSIEARPQK